MTTTGRGVIFGLLAAAIWGGMYVVSDVVLKSVPPFTLLTIRLILGITVLGFLVWRGREHIQLPNRQQTMSLLGIGLLGFGISVGAQFVGTDESNAVNGSLVTSASPAFIVVFAAIILKESLTLPRTIAVALASIGVIIIIDPTKADFSSETFRGNIALSIAAVTWGLYSVLIRKVSAKTDTIVITLIAFFGGLFLTIPASMIELQSRPITLITTGTIIGILYLGIISTAGAMWLWNRAFALVDASIVSLTFFAQPLVGAILAALFLGQTITFPVFVGGVLIILGVLLAIYPSERFSRRKTV